MTNVSNTYVNIRETATLMGVPRRTAQLMASDGRLAAQLMSSNGGQTYFVDAATLPVEAQLRLFAAREGKPETAADLAGYEQKYGEEGLKKLMGLYDGVREMALYKAQGSRELTRKRQEVAGRLGISASRLYQLEQAYREQGLSGLMGSRKRKDKGVPRAMCLMAQDVVCATYCVGSKVAQNVVFDRLKRIAEGLGREACAICPYNEGSLYRAQETARGRIPEGFPKCERLRECEEPPGMLAPESRCTVNRYIETLPPGVVAAGRMGVRYWEARFMPKVIRQKPEKANEVWFGDHHVFDVFVLHDGKPVRPWLTAWTDARSGAFVGWLLSLNPNSHTIIESLALAMGRTVGSPFSGMPYMLYIDNGKDYRCKRIEGDGLRDYELGKLNADFAPDNALLKTLGIGVTHAIPYRAWSKTIERIFGIIETQWIRELPGWCGNGIDQKPESLNRDIREGRLMTFEQFAAYWANVILPEYHAYVPREDKDRRSPMEIYEQSEKAREGIPSWATLGVIKQNQETRIVRTQGVSFFGRMYDAPALDHYIGQYVQIRYDTREDAVLTVLDLDGNYLCAATPKESFRLIEEDEEKLQAHMERQHSMRKETLQALRMPRERVRMLGAMCMEIPDMTAGSTITSLVAEQAWRGREEKEEEIARIGEKRTASERAAGNRIRKALQESGLEALRGTGA